MRYAVFAGRDPRHKLALVGLTFLLPDAQMMASQRYAGGQAVAVRSVSSEESQALAALDIVHPWVDQMPGEFVAWKERWETSEEVRS